MLFESDVRNSFSKYSYTGDAFNVLHLFRRLQPIQLPQRFQPLQRFHQDGDHSLTASSRRSCRRRNGNPRGNSFPPLRRSSGKRGMLVQPLQVTRTYARTVVFQSPRQSHNIGRWPKGIQVGIEMTADLRFPDDGMKASIVSTIRRRFTLQAERCLALVLHANFLSGCFLGSCGRRGVGHAWSVTFCGPVLCLKCFVFASLRG